MKTALITGITGQDGSYLAELLLSKGYKVCGIVRRNSIVNNEYCRLNAIRDKITLYYGDMTDSLSLYTSVADCRPDEIYNLAAMSDVRISFTQPSYTANVDGIAVLNLLEVVRQLVPTAKVYQAGSSEMFGNSIDDDGYQRETTAMNPVSPYGCAKLFAHNICKTYRVSYHMFIVNGILFNHESPRRSTDFVTNKIAKEAVKIKKGLSNSLHLGTLESCRDWGHSKDYVNAMWALMQLTYPGDYIVASGISHSVKELVEYVFNKLDLDWTQYVKVSEKLYRPNELWHLRGNTSKLVQHINWKPKYTFETMLDEMIAYWDNEL